MNTTALHLNMFAMAAPQSRADILALAAEARAELASINAHLDELFADCPQEV